MRYRGAWSHGKASVIWREIHSAVGFSVTPNDSQIRRPCRMMTRRFWPDNRNRAKDGGEPVIKPNKQKTIGIIEVRSFWCPPAKHIDLLP